MADKIKKPSVVKAQEQAINVYCNRVEGDRKAVIRDLYNVLCQTQPYARYMQASDMTVEEMYGIAERLRYVTGSGWLAAYYMPIMPFCRAKPLRYVLAHRQELLGNKGPEAFGETFVHLERLFLLG